MASFLQKVAGKAGKAIDLIGRATNNFSTVTKGIQLPELKVSEKLQSWGGQVNPFNPPVTRASDNLYNYSGSQSTYDPYKNAYSTNKVLGASTTGGGNTGGVNNNPGQSNPNFYDQGIQNIQSQGDQGMDFIEQDYSNALGALAGQEQGLRGQADTAGQQIEGEAGQVRTQLGQEQATREQGVQQNLSTSERESASALQQARDLFRQTQQSNIAELSALGISSSSVAEALAERLGVETARRIAGVTGSLQEVRQNATKELTRVKDYYQSKLTDVQNQVQVQKANIQNALMAGLNQINTARNQAATDKARSRAELLSNVQNSISQLTQQQQQFEQSLKQWAAQKSAALTPIVTDPTFVNSLTQATNTFNQGFAPSGFQYVPEVSTDPYGRVQGNVKYALKSKEDELSNPFASQ